MIVLQIRASAGPLWFLGGRTQLPAAYLLLCILSNAISVFFPVGLKRGSMQPVNARVIPVVALYSGVLIGPFASLLSAVTAFLIAKIVESQFGLPMGWLYLLLSIISTGISWLIYRRSLGELGKWLWRNESEILAVVANIPE